MKAVRIVLLTIVVALIVFCAYLAMSFFGNPVLLVIVNNSANEYIAEKYPDKGFQVDGVLYDFKLGYYMASVSDPDLADCYFTLYFDGNGEFREDTYSGRYLSGLNTSFRINNEYNLLVASVFDSGALDYELDIGYGFIEFTSGDETSWKPEYAIPYSSLQLDGDFDVREFGREAGLITVYINTDDLSDEALATALLSIRDVFDEADVPFREIDMTFFAGEHGEDGRAIILGFDYSDIYEDGLIDRVHTARGEADEYYGALDEEKEAELQAG